MEQSEQICSKKLGIFFLSFFLLRELDVSGEDNVLGAFHCPRVCWLLSGTCPSCAVSGTPAVFAGAAPSGSWLFPKLNLVAKERACWEASFYFYRRKKKKIANVSLPSLWSLQT